MHMYSLEWWVHKTIVPQIGFYLRCIRKFYKIQMSGSHSRHSNLVIRSEACLPRY